MAIYRLWREPFTEQIIEVDAQCDSAALAYFAQKLGERFTLDDTDCISPYLMDAIEPNEPPKYTRPKISVYLQGDRS